MIKHTFEEEKYFVATGMSVYGGGFVKSLGETLLHADKPNAIKIMIAFPEYWKEYLEIGKKFIESEQEGE